MGIRERQNMDKVSQARNSDIIYGMKNALINNSADSLDEVSSISDHRPSSNLSQRIKTSSKFHQKSNSVYQTNPNPLKQGQNSHHENSIFENNNNNRYKK